MLKIIGVSVLALLLIYGSRPYSVRNIVLLLIELPFAVAVFFIDQHWALLFIVDFLFLIWISRNFAWSVVRTRLFALVWLAGSLLIFINIIEPSHSNFAISGLFLKISSIFIFRSNLQVFRDGFLRLCIPAMWFSTHYSECIHNVPTPLLLAIGAGALCVMICNINRMEISDLVGNSAILYGSLFLVMSVEYRAFSEITLLSFVTVSAALFLCDVKGWEIPSLLLVTPLPPLPFFFFEKMLVSTVQAPGVLWSSVVIMSLVMCVSLLNVNRNIRYKKVLWE